MKTLKLILFAAITLFLIEACSEKSTVSNERTDTYSCYNLYNGDTINYVDAKGNKQGRFILFDKDLLRNTAYTLNDTTHQTDEPQCSTCPGKPLEEGNYKDNKKNGVWTYYNTDGTIKETIDYKDDVVVK